MLGIISECNVSACRIGYSDPDLLQIGTGITSTACRRCTRKEQYEQSVFLEVHMLYEYTDHVYTDAEKRQVSPEELLPW